MYSFKYQSFRDVPIAIECVFQKEKMRRDSRLEYGDSAFREVVRETKEFAFFLHQLIILKNVAKD